MIAVTGLLLGFAALSLIFAFTSEAEPMQKFYMTGAAVFAAFAIVAAFLGMLMEAAK